MLVYMLAVNLAITAGKLGLVNLPNISPNMSENYLLKQIVCLSAFIAENICNCGPVETSFLLQEDGSYLLQEDGNKIII